MKKLTKMIAILLFPLMALPVAAQDKNQQSDKADKSKDECGMMAKMMKNSNSSYEMKMQHNMNSACGMMKSGISDIDAIGKSFHVVRHIADWQKELKLSETQIGTLMALREEFQKTESRISNEMANIKDKWKTLGNENSNTGELKKALFALHQEKAELQFDAWQMASKMKLVLNEDQKKQVATDMPPCDMMKDKI